MKNQKGSRSAYKRRSGSFFAIHIIVPIFLTGRKNNIFLMILFIKMSFFHYNIAKAFFAILLKGTEYGRSEKSTVLRRILRILYIVIKVYIKVSKYWDETASEARCFIPKEREGFFDKEKSNIFLNDFANGKIDTIRGGFVPRRSPIMEF